jgi:hypothetical protein
MRLPIARISSIDRTCRRFGPVIPAKAGIQCNAPTPSAAATMALLRE